MKMVEILEMIKGYVLKRVLTAINHENSLNCRLKAHSCTLNEDMRYN